LKFRRELPLLIKLFLGDILIEYSHLKDYEFDVITLMEIIEHIDLDQMPALEKNVFGFLKPKMVIITTPNYDFNYFFANEEKFNIFSIELLRFL